MSSRTFKREHSPESAKVNSKMATDDGQAIFPFTELPTELQLMIMCRLSLGTLCACTQVCSELNLLAEDEEIWTSLARRDFGVRLPAASADFSPKLFYRDVLHKYRRLLGLWQRRNLKHYGSLLRVSARGAALVFEEILPPLGSIFARLRPVPFLTLTKGRQDAAVRIECDMSLYACENVKIVEVKEEEKPVLNLILTDLVDHRLQPAQWQDRLRDFVTLMVGEEQVQPNLLLRFVTYYHSRSLLSYTRLRVKKVFPPSSRLPIWPGIFKGTYGPHGTELIHLVMPSRTSLLNTAGVKITGDPNVPCGETSFRITSSQCLDMPRECQASVEAMEAFLENPTYHEYYEGFMKDFVVPADCYQREGIEFNLCKGRWSCECRIAENMYQNPRIIPGIFVLFDEFLFAVIFLKLKSISLYHRSEWI